MIVHTIPETFIASYGEINDWIDARFPESVPEGRYIQFVNTRLDNPDHEKRDLADWIESPLNHLGWTVKCVIAAVIAAVLGGGYLVSKQTEPRHPVPIVQPAPR